MTLAKLVGLALGAALVLATSARAQDIQIAVAGPMTGSESAFGRQLRNGAEMAVADLNAAGGLLGRKLVLDVEDDACDPRQARAVAEKIVAAKIPFVAGHYCSSSSIPASEVYADNNVLQITPASTNPLFTERNLWNVARVVGRDDEQGTLAGDYIAARFRGRNIAILHDKTTYGKGLADETRKALNKAGVPERLYDAYNKGDKDYRTIVSRLKAENIDVVFIGGYAQEIGLIVRQMRAQGVRTVVMSGDALADTQFASIAGAAGDGTLFTFGPDPRNKPTAAAVVAKFRARNIEPEGYTLYAYAALQIWSQAAAKAGTIDPKRVMGTIKSGSWDTVLGRIDYDSKGDIKQLDYVVYKWDAKGGYTEINPTTQPPAAVAQVQPQPVVQPPPPPVAQARPPAASNASPPQGRRVALVVGNASYRYMPSLTNPRNDAADIASAMKDLGFETILATDLDRAGMNNAMERFSRLVPGASIAMVYYSGHGMQFEGKNYLLPIDASLESAEDVNRYRLMPLDEVVDLLKLGSGMKLIVLDACRNNPIERDFKNKVASLPGANRDAASTRGFARIDARIGLVITYATAPDSVASDGDGRNSPFTLAFLKNVATPDLDVRQMLSQVQTDVYTASKARQLPEISSLYVGPPIALKTTK